MNVFFVFVKKRMKTPERVYYIRTHISSEKKGGHVRWRILSECGCFFFELYSGRQGGALQQTADRRNFLGTGGESPATDNAGFYFVLFFISPLKKKSKRGRNHALPQWRNYRKPKRMCLCTRDKKKKQNRRKRKKKFLSQRKTRTTGRAAPCDLPGRFGGESKRTACVANPGRWPKLTEWPIDRTNDHRRSPVARTNAPRSMSRRWFFGAHTYTLRTHPSGKQKHTTLYTPRDFSPCVPVAQHTHGRGVH